MGPGCSSDFRKANIVFERSETARFNPERSRFPKRNAHKKSSRFPWHSEYGKGGIMKSILTLLILPVALMAAGLQNTPTAPRSGMPMRGMGMMCPMNLQGASMAVSDTPTGVALSITTSKPEDVAELRRRAEQMASMHSVDRPSPSMMQGPVSYTHLRAHETP